jgi:hypothetical protein
MGSRDMSGSLNSNMYSTKKSVNKISKGGTIESSKISRALEHSNNSKIYLHN